MLKHQQAKAEADICELQDGMHYDYSHDRECLFEKELVMEQIAHKKGSAAAVICRIFQCLPKMQLEPGHVFTNNVLGVVAFLGIAQTNDLSRILAKYLDEDEMLAIVCKSHTFASNIVEYHPDGSVNTDACLHGLAAHLGLPIKEKYDGICLDDLRVYAGEFSSDPDQRKLALPNPTLSNGKPPPGFLGYAVNMIDPGVACWHWKTSSGDCLRETLFYHLFGKLHVYETREDMDNASSCITEEGAVSLDGGITKNGIFSVGCWESDIKFPVICSETRRHFSIRSLRIMNQVDRKKQEIRKTAAQLKREEEKLIKATKNLNKLQDRRTKFLDEKEPLLRDFYMANETSTATNTSVV